MRHQHRCQHRRLHRQDGDKGAEEELDLGEEEEEEEGGGDDDDEEFVVAVARGSSAKIGTGAVWSDVR